MKNHLERKLPNRESKIENSTMSLQRDYILRLVEQLREFLAQIIRLREGSRPDDALVAIMHAQEQLFACPSAQFGALLPDAQFHMLILGEQPEQARAKILLQADLLAETARVYDAKDQLALAQGARHYALALLRHAAAQFSGDASASAEGVAGDPDRSVGSGRSDRSDRSVGSDGSVLSDSSAPAIDARAAALRRELATARPL